jgi:hypothetical protein
MSKDLPPETANLYPLSNDWKRVGPWVFGKAKYTRSTHGEQTVAVVLPSYLITNTAAAEWEIARQLKDANNAKRRRESKAANRRR